MRAGKSNLIRIAIAGALSLAGVGTAAAFPVMGLNSSNQLFFFDTTAPANIYGQANITGLQPGETILAIDERPATGQLYGLGSSSRLYIIDRLSGIATPVGAGPFAPLLSGTSFGFDFNPTVDRIRIVSNTGQNLRAHPDTGVIAFVDGSLNGAAAAADGAAYINSVAPTPATTTLFIIDSASDTLYTQNPPNAGTLVAVGALGVNATAAVGFDVARTGEAIAGLTVGGVSSAYSVNLTTGAATSLGTIGATNVLGLIANPLSSPSSQPSVIPTLSLGWLAGLTLLLGGVGFAAFRRYS